MTIRTILLAAASAVLLSGCAMTPQLRQVAVDHNRMVAEVEDELTLRNIVRASQRFPLHFTTFTEVNGNATLTVGGELGAEFPVGDDTYSPKVSAGVETSPNFKLGVNSTEKFQRGVQKPIDAALVAYYLESGWRDEVIMAMLVERVDVVDRKTLTSTGDPIVNNAESSSAFVRILCSHELVPEISQSTKRIAKFAEIYDDKPKANSGEKAKATRSEIKGALELLANEQLAMLDDTLYLRPSAHRASLRPREHNRCKNDPYFAYDSTTHVLVPRFRSTLGVIYFLGEYVRGQHNYDSGVWNEPPYQLPACEGDCGTHKFSQRPLIEVQKGNGPALVATQFRGQRYYISDRELREGQSVPRSLQAIALVQQLLNLHKSSDELPYSISVSGGP